MDTQGRDILAADRFERLRRDAQPPWDAAGGARRRLGGLLVAAGLRVDPEALPPQHRLLNRGGAAPTGPDRGRAARPA